MAGRLYDYLPELTPDYSGSTLAVTPQKTLTEDVSKNVAIHQSDGDDEVRVILSDAPVAYVTLQWDKLRRADADTLMDFWMDPAKANGMAYSFPWLHPDDGRTYVVRFASNASRDIKEAAQYGFGQVSLRVLGVMPE